MFVNVSNDNGATSIKCFCIIIISYSGLINCTCMEEDCHVDTHATYFSNEPHAMHYNYNIR